jgi:hypothetical protein
MKEDRFLKINLKNRKIIKFYEGKVLTINVEEKRIMWACI